MSPKRMVANNGGIMTTDEQISTMKKAIAQAIKVMGDRFGSTEQDIARAIQDLKTSMEGGAGSGLSGKTMLKQVANHPLLSKPL